MFGSPSMSQDQPESVDNFCKELERQQASELTIRNYRSDLLSFARWFETTLGESFSPTAVTPTDIREYRSFLINVERRQPATVNRRLAALRRFFLWAQAEGVVQESPTTPVKGVSSTPRAPKSLEKREVDSL